MRARLDKSRENKVVKEHDLLGTGAFLLERKLQEESVDFLYRESVRVSCRYLLENLLFERKKGREKKASVCQVGARRGFFFFFLMSAERFIILFPAMCG